MTVADVEILLVEDNSADEELTLRALREIKVANRVHVVRDGAEALDFMFARGSYAGRNPAHVPKVVLLDLKLPKLDGIEVLSALKAETVTRVVPVVMLTSSREEPDIARCYALGVNSYIVKPVEFEGFIKAVADAGLYWMLLNQLPRT